MKNENKTVNKKIVRNLSLLRSLLDTSPKIPKEALSDDCFVQGISIGCDKFCPLLVAGKCTLPKKEQKQILKG